MPQLEPPQLVALHDKETKKVYYVPLPFITLEEIDGGTRVTFYPMAHNYTTKVIDVVESPRDVAELSKNPLKQADTENEQEGISAKSFLIMITVCSVITLLIVTGFAFILKFLFPIP